MESGRYLDCGAGGFAAGGIMSKSMLFFSEGRDRERSKYPECVLMARG